MSNNNHNNNTHHQHPPSCCPRSSTTTTTTTTTPNNNNNNNELSTTSTVTSIVSSTNIYPNQCLHCTQPPTNSPNTTIQVSCDDCHSFICSNCHWCHEFQANHEIRVCDRCDAFYCKSCDEMDQCEDCSEVVCGSCSSLMSCKFCGCGLCEDCATACGRCGIVLCGRDVKFAVECDTCRMSYCLVCLASGGGREVCVRCGQRPSKRVEQLVHLRLKSIYKAFRQSGGNGRKEEEYQRDLLAGDVGAVLQAAAAAAAATAEGAQESKRREARRKSSGVKSGNNDVASRTMADADRAAEELLRQIDMEEKSKGKKKKKKKKANKKPMHHVKTEQHPTPQQQQPAPQKDAHAKAQDSTPLPSQHPQSQNHTSGKSKADNNEDDLSTLILPSHRIPPPATHHPDLEAHLSNLISSSDIPNIQKLLQDLKGVPGKSALRKNAKKALKKLALERENRQNSSAASSSSSNDTSSYKPPEPLLKLVSHTTKPSNNNNSSSRNQPPSSSSSSPKTECVMHMSPSVVGWVIGKGGQRIRDLMEESAAKVWIDQDSMGPKQPRIVYVSGNRKAVDTAVRMVKDLVAKAPLGAEKKTDGNNLVNKKDSKPMSTTTMPLQPTPPPPPQHPLPSPTPDNPSKQHIVSEILQCEPRFVALLIGRKGWTVKHIQDASGAKVDIDQTCTPRKITVSGIPPNVKAAIKMVNDVLSYPHAQLHYNLKDSSSSSSSSSLLKDDQQVVLEENYHYEDSGSIREENVLFGTTASTAVQHLVPKPNVSLQRTVSAPPSPGMMHSSSAVVESSNQRRHNPSPPSSLFPLIANNNNTKKQPPPPPPAPPQSQLFQPDPPLTSFPTNTTIQPPPPPPMGGRLFSQTTDTTNVIPSFPPTTPMPASDSSSLFSTHSFPTPDTATTTIQPTQRIEGDVLLGSRTTTTTPWNTTTPLEGSLDPILPLRNNTSNPLPPPGGLSTDSHIVDDFFKECLPNGNNLLGFGFSSILNWEEDDENDDDKTKESSLWSRREQR